MPAPSGESPVQARVDIGDSEISYLYYAGGGVPLVMLHATGFNPWLWHPLARALCGMYRVYCPYFCDHRPAEPEVGGFNWMLLADDLARFCEVLNITAPYLVGHSMGGAVMTIACGHFDLTPSGMILIEPIFLPQEFYNIDIRVEDHPLAGKSIKRRNEWRDHEEVRAYLTSKPLFRDWDDEMLELYIRYGMVGSDAGGLVLACPPRREAALFMGGIRYDPWPLMPAIHCPVLVLEGEQTENKGLIDFKKAAGRFPRGEYQMVENAGHLIPMEKPEETVNMIRAFFAAS